MPSAFLYSVCMLCLAVMIATAFMCVYRIVIGPRAADRTIALDTAIMAFIGMICILCIVWGNSWYFDAVWILTLVGFIGTVAIAKYLEKGRVF